MTITTAIQPVTIVIASIDRPAILRDLLDDLTVQTVPPHRIVLSVTRIADLPDDLSCSTPVETLTGPKGSCAQRNTALDHLADQDGIFLFCDDDYVPSRHLVERVGQFFAANPDVVGCSGQLLADGINGPGFSIEESRAMVAEHDRLPAPSLSPIRDRYGLYGCNMALRADLLRQVRFDERLPLYGWQEDIDFAAQLLPKGRLVGTHAFAGVHRGVKVGRTRGIRLGYSQVANPAYLARKGTMRPRYAWRIALHNVAANHVKALRPEPWVDRRGRVLGNWLAILDLLRGRVTPERILRL